MATGLELAAAIRNADGLLGIPHKELDCQAAVERALSLVGVKVNYRGSNHMWREMVTERCTISQFRDNHGGFLVPGLICFHVKHDGGEADRGYHDSLGNAVHVGVILDDQTIFHSGGNGTEIKPLRNSTFDCVGYCTHLLYNAPTDTEDDPWGLAVSIIDGIQAKLKEIAAQLDILESEVKLNG